MPFTVISPLKPPRTLRTPMYGMSLVLAGVVMVRRKARD